MASIRNVFNDALARGVGVARGVGPVRALGADRDEILAETGRSPNLADGVFANLEPASPPSPAANPVAMRDMLLHRPGQPNAPVPVVPVAGDRAGESGALTVTWLGHASALVEIDGVRVLTDPVLSRRCSPSQQVGPARMHPAPLTPTQLPPVDVVLISHDHYDHLDTGTVTAIARQQPRAIFVAPIGVGAHLRSWGIDGSRIRLADWNDELTQTIRGRELRFVLSSARHFSGRGLTRNQTLWGSWAVLGPQRRFFFSGDTGFTERYADLGLAHGPFDVSLIAVGAYDPAWPDIHLNPEEAVLMHSSLSGSAGRDALFIPIHWGTFNLARHSWGNPIARLLTAAERSATSVIVPPPGGVIDVEHRRGSGTENPDWWEHCA